MNTFVYGAVGLVIGLLTAPTMSTDNTQLTPFVWLGVVVLFTVAGALTGKIEELVAEYKEENS
jgi:uncharacterized protein YacL